MYLIIIKSSFNYYTHSRPRCTRREPNCRNAFSVSLLLVANTTAVVASTSIVSIIIISFALLLCFPFFFHSGRVVVLAATTTGFSFLFFSSLFCLSLFFLSMLTLFPISKHTALLTGCYKKKHNDERTFRVIVRKREKEGETRRLPRRSLLNTKDRSF